MTETSLNRTLAALAAAAGLIVACMVAAIVATSASQDFFQSARSSDAFLARLAASPSATLGLRLNLGFDNLFIVVYGAFFVFLSVRLRSLLDPWVSAVALVALLLTALLDAVENHHIAEMVHAASHGLAVTAGESQAQMAASQVKFHCSYLGASLFAFGLWRMGGLGRAIAVALWLYVPFGVLISVLPVEAAAPWALGRTCFFVAAFVLSALHFRQLARS
jgi:hypothetical protein